MEVLWLREQQVAISADIEQMFIQINVAPSGCAFVFFFGIAMAKSKKKKNSCHFFGEEPYPFIASYAVLPLARDNQENFSQVLHFVERIVYMDDLQISTANVESAVKLMNITRDCLSVVLIVTWWFWTHNMEIQFRQSSQKTLHI